MRRKRIYCAALVVCATVLLIVARMAPAQIRLLGITGTVGMYAAPGMLLYGAIGLIFPSLIADPTEDISELTGDALSHRRIEVLLPLACLAMGAVAYWWLLHE